MRRGTPQWPPQARRVLVTKSTARDIQTSPSTLANEVKMSAKMTSLKGTGEKMPSKSVLCSDLFNLAM